MQAHLSTSVNCSAVFLGMVKNLAILWRAAVTCSRRPWLEVTVNRVWPACRVCRATAFSNKERVVSASW